MKSLYEILEVNENASKKEIDKKYKTLVKRYHPDLQPEEKKQTCEELLKKITDAYSILGDEEKKKQYDEERRLANENGVRFDVDNNNVTAHFVQKPERKRIKITKKDIIAFLILIAIIIMICVILWLIPPIRKMMIDIYNNNAIVNIMVGIFIGFFKGVTEFFKIVFNL